jgi:hypothetical protein
MLVSFGDSIIPGGGLTELFVVAQIDNQVSLIRKKISLLKSCPFPSQKIKELNALHDEVEMYNRIILSLIFFCRTINCNYQVYDDELLKKENEIFRIISQLSNLSGSGSILEYLKAIKSSIPTEKWFLHLICISKCDISVYDCCSIKKNAFKNALSLGLKISTTAAII